MLDPQVQIRIIDLAEEWSKIAIPRATPEKEWFTQKAENFDKAYKAILKTVQSESESGVKPSVKFV